MSPKPNIVSEEIQDAASGWLSRRDRGLTAAEQDAYLEWLYRNPEHGRAIVQLERVWASLNQLEQWRPAHSAVPNPDLLARRRPARLAWWGATLAAAAAIALGLFLGTPSRPVAAPRAAIIHPGPERMELADGSVVELNTGARVEVNFTPGARGVRLMQGEAHFTVAKDPSRPFTVNAGPVAVRAVGTAFSMALGSQEVAVLVTEGKVEVVEQGAGSTEQGVNSSQSSAANAQPPSYLIAGQRAVVNLAAPAVPTVRELTPAQIEQVLAWQGIRMEFEALPLGDVVMEFNRYNRTQLSVADADTAAILVGGTFRADNVDAFVRLLESGFGVRAFRHGNDYILRRAP